MKPMDEVYMLVCPECKTLAWHEHSEVVWKVPCAEEFAALNANDVSLNVTQERNLPNITIRCAVCQHSNEFTRRSDVFNSVCGQCGGALRITHDIQLRASEY